VVVIVAVATSVIVANSADSDPYSFSNMGISAVTDASGRISVSAFRQMDTGSETQRGTRLVVVLLPVFLHMVTGLPLELIHFLPVTGVLLPIVGYVLVNRLLRSRVYGAFFGLCVALSPNITRTYNMNTAGYGFLFLLLTVFISVMQVKPTRRNWFLFITFYLMTILSYYTYEFYAFVYVAVFLLLSRIPRFRRGGHTKHVIGVGTVLIFLTMTYLIDPLLQIVLEWSGGTFGGNTLNAFANFWSTIAALIERESVPTYSGVSLSREAFLVDLVSSVLIVVPVVYYVLSSVIRKARSGGEIFYVFHSLLVGAAATTLAYALSLRYITTSFLYSTGPLLSIVGLDVWFTRKRLIKGAFMTAILVSLVASFAVISITERTSNSLSHEFAMDKEYIWVGSHSKNARILTSVEESTRLVFATARSGTYKNLAIRVYDDQPTKVSFLYLGGSDRLEVMKLHYRFVSQNPVMDFILVNRMNLNERIEGNSWVLLPPLATLSPVYNTPGVNVVFDGGDLILLGV